MTTVDRRSASKLVLWAAMSAAASGGVCAGQEKSGEGTAAATYSEMLARVQKGDLAVDFGAFRIAGTEQSANASMRETVERAAFKKLAAAGDWAGALDSAKHALERNYASPIAHFNAMTAYQNLGKPDEAAFHEKILNAMLDSIGQSGDGKGPQTAYVVVTVQEEYIFMNRTLHLRPTGQGLVQQGKHAYDRLTVADPATGQSQDIWFNIDIDFGQALK